MLFRSVLNRGAVAICDLSVGEEELDADRFAGDADAFESGRDRRAGVAHSVMRRALFDRFLVVEVESGPSRR